MSLAHDLDGLTVGTPDGTIICDGCGARVDLARPSPDREDQDNPHSETFTGYATKRGGRGWYLSKVYCTDCDEREINMATGGYDEAMGEIEIEFIGLTNPPCMVIDAEIIDRSRPSEGPRA